LKTLIAEDDQLFIRAKEKIFVPHLKAVNAKGMFMNPIA
jgi:hypothetical protein